MTISPSRDGRGCTDPQDMVADAPAEPNPGADEKRGECGKNVRGGEFQPPPAPLAPPASRASRRWRPRRTARRPRRPRPRRGRRPCCRCRCARPFLIASSTSAFGGRSSSRFGPTCRASRSRPSSVWQCGSARRTARGRAPAAAVSSLTLASGIELRSLSVAITASRDRDAEDDEREHEQQRSPPRRPRRRLRLPPLARALGAAAASRGRRAQRRGGRRGARTRGRPSARTISVCAARWARRRRAAVRSPARHRRRPAAKLWTAGATPRKSASAPSAGTSPPAPAASAGTARRVAHRAIGQLGRRRAAARGRRRAARSVAHEDVDRPAGDRQLLQPAAREQQRLGAHGQPVALVDGPAGRSG